MEFKEQLKIAKEWVEALRSGKYIQQAGAWYVDYGDASGYCCLGVLASLRGIDMELGDQELSFTACPLIIAEKSPLPIPDFFNEKSSIVHWPCRLSREEFNTLYPDFPYRDNISCNVLADLNDDGMSFEDIAFIIDNSLVPYLELRCNEPSVS